MKQRWLRSITSALGVTTLCCFWIVGPLVSPSHAAIYHWSGPVSTLFIPATMDFLCIWSLFSFLLFASQLPGRLAVTIWAATMVFVPLAATESFFLFKDWHLAHWISISLLCLGILLFLLFLVLFSSVGETRIRRLQSLTTNVLLVVAVCGGLVLLQLVWFGWQARRLNSRQELHAAETLVRSPKAGPSRIIWILLDELSYKQVFGQRYPGLKLPAFDELAAQATVFSNVRPAGIMTDIVMPSLISGVPVDGIHASSSGDALTLHNPQTRRWQAFDAHDTVFNDALEAGYATAIAGWYNPYCRILPQVLDQCYWTYDELSANRMLSRASLARNFLNPLLLSSSLMNHLPSSFATGDTSGDLLARLHILDYRQISDAADKILRDPSMSFIFIHMAIPHPGGIYSRATHSFATRDSSYLDNLALADSYMAHVRTLLEASGQWDPSAVIIMGDHSWRTRQLWMSASDWTREDQLASHGQFDDRPAYIVKLPEQKEGSRLNLPFAAVHTRMLFDGIMQKQITSSQELSAWVSVLDHTPPHQ